MAPGARGATALFDFDNGPVHVSLPLDLTVAGVTAHLSATVQGFSIQDPTQSIGLTPTGFRGFCLSPNSVFAADLLVAFPQEVATSFSIMGAGDRHDGNDEDHRVSGRRVRRNEHVAGDRALPLANVAARVQLGPGL